MPTRSVRRAHTAWFPVTAAPFNPSSITGLAAWYDASNAASITASSGAVSQWNDLSGNARHLTQASGANQPTTGTRTQNSLNVIDFDGSNDFLSAASNWTSGFTAATTFIVKRIDTNPGGVGLWQIGAASNDAFVPFTDSNIYETFGTSTRRNWLSATPIAAAHSYTVVAASADFRAYVNGTADFSSGTNTVGFSATPVLCATSLTVMDGWVAEWLVYNSALGTTDRQNVEGYLRTKWGTP